MFWGRTLIWVLEDMQEFANWRREWTSPVGNASMCQAPGESGKWGACSAEGVAGSLQDG